MKIPKITDEELNHTFEIYKLKGDFQKLREVSSLWIIQNASKRFRLEEDDISEMYIDFFSKFENCINIFNEKKYTNILSYLSVFAKHTALNTLRKKKSNYPEEYFSLWNVIYTSDMENPLLPGITYSDFYGTLKNLSPFGRIIISLRYNLILQEEEREFFLWYMNSTGICIHNFYQNHEVVLYDKIVKRNIILRQINSCNRKIFLSKTSNLKYQQRKKQLIQQLSNTYKLYSLKEIAEILRLKPYKVHYYYNVSIQFMKKFLKNDEFTFWEERIAA